MPDIFFTADLHLGHYNIIRYCDRPFSSVQEMDNIIIENWNDYVGPKDFVYVLGDFAFRTSTTDDVGKYFRVLNGQKFLISGNHDKGHVKYLTWGWIKDVYLLKGLNKFGIWLSHYAHRTWPHSFRGSWHLYGHTHGRLAPHGRSFDIGVDSWEFRPVPFDEVQLKIEELEQSEIFKEVIE